MSTIKSTVKCVICGEDVEEKLTPSGEVYWNQGENAEPVAEGRCCEECNTTVVIPERLRLVMGGRKKREPAKWQKDLMSITDFRVDEDGSKVGYNRDGEPVIRWVDKTGCEE